MTKRKIYFILSFIFFILTSFVGDIYRNYIYENNINDYYLADIYTNIGAVLSVSFLYMGYVKNKDYKYELALILSVVLGFIIYEFIQSTPLIGVFYWKDILGTIIGGVITLGFHRIITKKINSSDRREKT